jgi:hypothetical protein
MTESAIIFASAHSPRQLFFRTLFPSLSRLLVFEEHVENSWCVYYLFSVGAVLVDTMFQEQRSNLGKRMWH